MNRTSSVGLKRFVVEQLINDDFLSSTSLNELNSKVISLNEGRFKLELRKTLVKLSYGIWRGRKHTEILESVGCFFDVFCMAISQYNISIRDISKMSKAKHEVRGGFKKGLFLKSFDFTNGENTDLVEKYKKNVQEKIDEKTTRIMINKLVRDLTEEDLAAKNISPNLITLSEVRFKIELRKKLVEESYEVLSAKTYKEILEELTDIYDVFFAVLNEYQISLSDLPTETRYNSLQKKLFLKFIDLPEDHKMAQYYRDSKCKEISLEEKSSLQENQESNVQIESDLSDGNVPEIHPAS